MTQKKPSVKNTKQKLISAASLLFIIILTLIPYEKSSFPIVALYVFLLSLLFATSTSLLAYYNKTKASYFTFTLCLLLGVSSIILKIF